MIMEADKEKYKNIELQIFAISKVFDNSVNTRISDSYIEDNLKRELLESLIPYIEIKRMSQNPKTIELRASIIIGAKKNEGSNQ